jgi:hypothetical protein
MGLFSKSFSVKKATPRRSASLNNLVAMDPTLRQREFNPEPENVSKLLEEYDGTRLLPLDTKQEDKNNRRMLYEFFSIFSKFSKI